MKDNEFRYLFYTGLDFVFFVVGGLDYIRNVGVVTTHFDSVRKNLSSDSIKMFTECLSR